MIELAYCVCQHHLLSWRRAACGRPGSDRAGSGLCSSQAFVPLGNHVVTLCLHVLTYRTANGTCITALEGHTPSQLIRGAWRWVSRVSHGG